MIESVPPPKKVLVAFDANQDYQTILDIAALLALHQRAELSALFVEDINLIHLAGLPFVSEIDRISSNQRPLDTLKIAQDLEKQVLQIRHLLDDFKKRSRIEISLTVVRGHYISEALAAAANVDLLLLDKRRNRQKGSARQSLRKAFIRPIWVVFDGSQASERALLLTAELLKRQHAELNIVLKTDNNKTVTELEGLARQLTAGIQANKHFFVLEKEDYSSVLQCIVQRGCSILIMNANRQEKGITDYEAAIFSEKADCPVLLVT